MLPKNPLRTGFSYKPELRPKKQQQPLARQDIGLKVCRAKVCRTECSSTISHSQLSPCTLGGGGAKRGGGRLNIADKGNDWKGGLGLQEKSLRFRKKYVIVYEVQ